MIKKKNGTGGFDGESLKGLVHHTLPAGAPAGARGWKGPYKQKAFFRDSQSWLLHLLYLGTARRSSNGHIVKWTEALRRRGLNGFRGPF